jgi:iron complex outermembrane receptor protein
MIRLLVALLLSMRLCSALADPTTDSATGAALEEVVVTAEKRTQNLQDVPASVAAFTPEALAQSHINDTVALQLLTPGLLVTTNGDNGQPYIRGIGSGIINPGTDPPVAIFIDGAYQPRPISAISQFFDDERVEVLKGPQGTLYGRNATGGAISIITQDPTQELGGDADLQLGNYRAEVARAAFNAPLSDDTAIRISGFYASHEGYTENAFNGSRIDNQNLWGTRVKLRYAPSSRLTLVVSGEYTRENDSRGLAEKVVDDPSLPLPVRDLAHDFGYPTPVFPADPFVIYNDFPDQQLVTQARANATLTYTMDAMEFKSITAFTRVADDYIDDLDGTQINFSYEGVTDFSDTFTQNFQLSSTDKSPLQWLAGLEYLHEGGGQNFDARVPYFGPASSNPFGVAAPAGFIWYSTIRTNAASALVDLKYDLLPRLTVSAGVRYSWEKKSADFLETVIDPYGIITGTAGGIFETPAHPEQTWRASTPKFGLEFRPLDATLLYLTVTKGFKSGGFNLMNTAETFQPETIWSYEVGMKSTWLDERLRTNLAAFYYDYKNMQVEQFSGVTNLVTNAASSHIEGVEAQIDAKATEVLTVDLGLAYLHGKYESYLTTNANDPTGGQVNLGGNWLPEAPQFTATVGSNLRIPLESNGSLSARGEVRYQSKIYFDQFNTPQLTQDGYAIVNGRLTYTPARGGWDVAAYGENLTDKYYRQGMVRVDNVFGTIAFYGVPRTFGIEGRYHF